MRAKRSQGGGSQLWSLQLLDAFLELRDARGDVRQLDDIRLRVRSSGASVDDRTVVFSRRSLECCSSLLFLL